MKNALQTTRVEEGSLIEDETGEFDGSTWIFKYRAVLEPMGRQVFRVTKVPGFPVVTVVSPSREVTHIHASIIGWNQGSPFLCLQNNDFLRTAVIATVHVLSTKPVTE